MHGIYYKMDNLTKILDLFVSVNQTDSNSPEEMVTTLEILPARLLLVVLTRPNTNLRQFNGCSFSIDIGSGLG